MTAKRTTKPRGASRLAVEYMPTAALRPYPGNARMHDDAQVQAIAASITRFGWGQPILAEEDGTVIAGHGRLAAALLLKLDQVPVVRLTSITPEQARALRLADNRTAELATWDEELLTRELGELSELNMDLADVGFSDAEIAELLGGTLEEAPPPPAAAPVADDDEPEPDIVPLVTEPVTELGDVWHLGRHRLVCGDSLNGDAVDVVLAGEKAAAVITDPPYAIHGSSSGVSSSVADDKMVRPFLRGVVALAQRATAKFAHVYIFCDWRSLASWWEVAKGTRIECKNVLVWNKNGSGLGNWYANTHELVFFAAHCPKQTTMRANAADMGHRTVHHPNVLTYPRPRGEERLHNAAKPVDMITVFVTKSTDDGALVLDPFCGSGSTLIACELSGRRCATVDIDAANCDITIARWQRRTGQVAVRESDGVSFDARAAMKAAS